MTLIITDGFPRNLGELTVDERPCGHSITETDTYTCSHCERVVARLYLNSNTPPKKCGKCGRHLCKGCEARMAVDGQCRSFHEMGLAAVEKAYKLGL